jgi:hypothetical protein
MKLPTTLKPVILAALLTQPVFAGPLDTYRGANRLIVVSVPDGPSAGKVATALVKHREKIQDRELKIIDVSEGTHRIPAALRLPPEQTTSIRKQFNLTTKITSPVFILIGKDGGEKARQTGTLDLDKWFVLIDRMPMRRREMQNQRKEAH